MARRSLKASPEGITTLKETLKRKKWSQTYLAGASGCSRQTIWSLFHGNPIDAEVFLGICTQLGLSEHEIAEADEEAGEVLELDKLVRQVRGLIKPWIQEQYGSINVLSMTRPIGVGDIYTDVYFLEKPTGRQRLSLKELEANCLKENFDRFGFSDYRKGERVSGLDAVDQCQKMVVLGKPGAGKTTFLKRIATQCNLGTFHPGLIPIFVTLKQFAETKGQPDLFAYIANQWAECKVKDSESKLERLLDEGRALILLDGLDEVNKADSSRIIEDVRRFSQRFYNNLYVLTCRIATHEFKLEPFTEVEIADFDDQQIAVFVTKWFELKNPERTESFLRKLKESPRVRELATNPLLLTLLCLGFEDSAYFSDSRAVLYKDALNVLLKTWNSSKPGGEPEQVYCQLTPDRKADLLSQLAYQTFEQGQYFFSEKIAKQHIGQYIANLPSIDTDPKQLSIDSEVVLKSIEGQHGLLISRAHRIYSFSHLTFQEYFTARKIATSCNPYADDDKTLQRLARYVIDKRWREVILLTVEMLPSADRFLQFIKQYIDALIAEDDTLQELLSWVQQKTNSVDTPYKSTSVRAFYMMHYPIGFDQALDNALIQGCALNCSLGLDYTLERAYDRSVAISTLVYDLDDRDIIVLYENTTLVARDLAHALDCNLEPEFQKMLQNLKAQLPNSEGNHSAFKAWWKEQGKHWIETLSNAIIKYQNIGHNWSFTPDQTTLLQQYFVANLLLIDCLNNNCYVNRSIRKEIEDTLLLPIAEIENLSQKGRN